MSFTSESAAARDRRLAGHLGHLTPTQDEKFEAFKKLVIEDKVLIPGELSHETAQDDVTLLRYLRARKWSIDGALKQLKATAEWFQAEDVDTIYDEFDADEFLMGQDIYPQWTGARTRAGHPLFVYRLDKVTNERLEAYNRDPGRLNPRAVALTRGSTTWYLPLANALPHPDPDVPIDCLSTIIDMSNTSLTRFWALRGFLQRSTELATAHLPETSGVLYIVGAPSIWYIIWRFARTWFDEGTTDKVQILSPSETLSGLSVLIDPKSIPKAYGGESDWHWDENGGRPKLDEATRHLLGLEPSAEPPVGPLRFSQKTGIQVVGKGRTEEQLRLNGKGRREDTKEVIENGTIANGQASAEVKVPAVVKIIGSEKQPMLEAQSTEMALQRVEEA